MTGVILIYQSSQLGGGIIHAAVDFTLLYLSISVSLNVLLTFTIIIWFVLHTKNDRVPMGAPAGIGVLCKAITTMFVESSALYAVSSLLVLVPWIARSSIVEVFLPVLAETQVRTFLQPISSDRLFNVATDRTGHVFIAHHSKGRREERVRKRHQRVPRELD